MKLLHVGLMGIFPCWRGGLSRPTCPDIALIMDHNSQKSQIVACAQLTGIGSEDRILVSSSAKELEANGAIPKSASEA